MSGYIPVPVTYHKPTDDSTTSMFVIKDHRTLLAPNKLGHLFEWELFTESHRKGTTISQVWGYLGLQLGVLASLP